MQVQVEEAPPNKAVVGLSLRSAVVGQWGFTSQALLNACGFGYCACIKRVLRAPEHTYATT